MIHRCAKFFEILTLQFRSALEKKMLLGWLQNTCTPQVSKSAWRKSGNAKTQGFFECIQYW